MKTSEYKLLREDIDQIKKTVEQIASVMLPQEEEEFDPISEIMSNAAGMTTAEKVEYFKTVKIA